MSVSCPSSPITRNMRPCPTAARETTPRQGATSTTKQPGKKRNEGRQLASTTFTIDENGYSANLFSLCFLSGRGFGHLLFGYGSLDSLLLLGGATAAASLLLGLGSLCHVLIEVYKLDESDGGGVATTVAQLDDAGVATRTVSRRVP